MYKALESFPHVSADPEDVRQRCTNCHVLKKSTAFHKGRKNCTLCCRKKRIYGQRVKERDRLKRARYYLKNRERILARVKEYSQSPEVKKRIAKNHRKYRARNPLKAAARAAVNHALRDRRIKKLPCQKCGSKKSQAHHTDYKKPLEVTWLCIPCHWLEHRIV